MSITKYTFIPLLFICFFTTLQAQSNEGWMLKNEKNDVKVFYRKTSDIYEIKLITSIKSSLSGLVTLLSEVENYPGWGYKVAESRLISQTSDKESVYYSRLDFPWPLDDRDIIMHNHIEQDPISRKIVATSVAAPATIPENSGVVRIKTAKTKWTIVPGQGGWLYVEYYIYSDPGGSLPDWLVNMAIDVGPRETIKNIRGYVSQPKYQSAKLAYIKE
jgi:START domain